MRTKALRALYSHSKNSKRGAEVTLKEYKRSTEGCYDLHLLLLWLLVDVREYALERQKIASQKLVPTAHDLDPKLRFVQNSIIEALANNTALQDRLASKRLNWRKNDEVVREIYNQIIASDSYQSYQDGAGKDKEFIINILSTLFEDNAILEAALEDMSIYWADDIGYALSQAIVHIERCKDNEILPIYKNNDDKRFGENILLHAITHNDEYRDIIESLIENWDLERTAFMDRVIMIIALSEIVSCPTIPIKVSLNEYIEISKYYSTPTSSSFINGVLNRAVDKLTGEDKIVKTGRGLVNS